MTNAAQVSAADVAASAKRHPTDVQADDVIRVMRPDGSLNDNAPDLSDEQVIELYRIMLRTRLIDERAVMLQRQGRIGFHIGSLGEEATIIGSAYALRQQDWLFPCYREFGAALHRGLPLQRYFDNLFGNHNDIIKGRQMPDHWCCRDANLTSVSSPIGTQITQAVGFAWAAKIKRDPLAVLVYFGDGATSSAEFHNGLNFAGVYATPTVFLCRNNGWAISVPTERQTHSKGFAVKAVAYGMPGVRCDGNDVFAVIKATRDAIARAASGQGPTLIEAMTYRLSGHSTSDDPTRYRPQEEMEGWHQRDPLLRLRHHLLTRADWDESHDKAIRDDITAELKVAIERAESAAPPSLESMFEDVYAELPWHLREQQQQLLQGARAKGHG
ncbi:MAG TPA: thiamine pyrophosphate-dependent dehydrogenase E1 component subunit alpha [Sorangium sp.]|nr:thiamine pyrophosphate-dependent dehydrogenase E1 component subunit alpha [Sorangium sp.]